MENITESFQDIHRPKKGLIIYENTTDSDQRFYVESYDISQKGTPTNFHPLTEREGIQYARTLWRTDDRKAFLHSQGLLPRNILLVDAIQGCAIWYTPPRKAPLFFKDNLNIPSGCGYVPPLIWKGTRDQLYLFALPNSKRPGPDTLLYVAPFFNIHPGGMVCMGDVKIKIAENTSLTAFQGLWEKYFYSSYFTHLIAGQSPVTGNIVQLWQQQIATGGKFPIDVLKKSGSTLKSILP